MISSDSFTPDSDCFSFSQPFALFLTHRRGGAVLVSTPSAIQSELSAENFFVPQYESCAKFYEALFKSIHHDRTLQAPANFEHFFSRLFAIETTQNPHEAFTLYSEHSFACAISHTTTAEQLAAMYAAVLQALGMDDSRVRALCVGVGPGSFTGLRLGCAFANGLAFGRERPDGLWAIPNFSRAQLMLAAKQAELEESRTKTIFGGIDASEDEGDEYASHVLLCDVLSAICALAGERAEKVPTFVPAYGREPGPVIKLREGALQRKG